MTIFEPPVATSHVSPIDHSTFPRKNKRKRREKTTQGLDEDEGLASDVSQPPTTPAELEYTAVVSPLERIQRRVAGQSLDDPIPHPPFPHAASREGRKPRTMTDVQPPDVSRSLHLQHLAALTAIIHRSLLQQDFQRAARALGLMLREDIIARSAAVRNKGFMGIAAEVLLRQDAGKATLDRGQSAAFHVSHTGLENAKKLYETLIIRHPYHKSWPESVNAVDFYLAMFNIWIYVVCSETNFASSKDGIESRSSSPRPDQLDSHALAKVRELKQANEIATRMDECMASVPYMDEPELIRLRAMVDLWRADLYETCHTVTVPLEQVSESDDDDTLEHKNPYSDYSRLARDARQNAQRLVSKLEGHPNDSAAFE